MSLEEYEVKEYCGHKRPLDPTITCTRPKGHNGAHHTYTEGPGINGEIQYQIPMWNNKGEERLPDICNVFDFKDHKIAYKKDREILMEKAISEAKKTLNPGDIFEIRRRHSIAVLKHGDGIAWYHMPKQPKGLEQWEWPEARTKSFFIRDVDDGEINDLGGYVLVARIKV